MTIVYSLPACADCVKLKFYLNRRGIEFKEQPMLELDISKRQEFYNLDLRQAPIIEINGKLMSGVNLMRVSEVLGASA